MIPFYAERGQKSNLLEESEVEDAEPENEVEAENENGNATNEPPRPPSENSIQSQHTPYSRQSSSKFNRQHQSTPIAKVLKTYFEDKQASKLNTKGDHLQKIFDAMQETVRTFQPRLQIEIKSKISNMVSEYELKDLMSKEQNNHFRPLQPVLTRSESAGSPVVSPGSYTNSEITQSPRVSPASETNYQFPRQHEVPHFPAHSSSMQTCDALLSPRDENNITQWQDQANIYEQL